MIDGVTISDDGFLWFSGRKRPEGESRRSANVSVA